VKKSILIGYCFVIASQVTFAQNWQWSKKITQPAMSNNYGINKGLLTDKNGIIYSYGSNYNGSVSDTIGSFLQSYSANGALLFSKQWKIPFHIRKMDYDGNNYFYFAGSFYGTQTINNITIISQGNDDGVIGKMDLQGNIIWMKTFGGGGIDAAYGLCFNPADNSVYASGRIQDTLFFTNSFQSVNSQAAIICQFSSLGTFIRYKLYDFPSQQNLNTNCCVEICLNQSGDIFSLMDRKADRWWSNDPGTGPLVGRYLIKLNSSLDTLWSVYINGPQSYYGWECNNLRAAANGDAYLLNWSSGKYGGIGQIMRLNGSTGKIKWTYPNQDGLYSDLFIDSLNTIYVTGNEGADGCPCEYNNPGYYVIKKIDENNTVIGETRILSVHLPNITKDILGNIFVRGTFWNNTAVVGPDIVVADSVFSGGYYNYTGMFLSKLSDINCTPPEINFVTHHPFVEIFCPSDSILLDAGAGYLTYLWSNGSSQEKIKTNSPGQYNVKVTESSGCTSYATPITIDAKKNVNAPVICLATYDTASKKNKFIWNLNFDNATRYYNVYKEITPGNNVIIQTFTYTNYNQYEYIDQHSSPDSIAEKYFLSTVDTCGAESPLSTGHRPIFLSIQTNNSKNILTWQPYDGFLYTKYYIYKGTGPNNLSVIDSISSTLTSYTVSNATQVYYYQVQVKKNWGCYIINNTVRISMSNIVSGNQVVSVNNSENMNNSITIYPNPTKGQFTLKLNEGMQKQVQYQGMIFVFDQLGNCILRQQFFNSPSQQIDISKMVKGIYFVEIEYEGGRISKKVIMD